MTRSKRVTPSRLPTKTVRASDGSVLRMKVVQSDSKTLGADLLSAFRSNVRRAREENKRVTAKDALTPKA